MHTEKLNVMSVSLFNGKLTKKLLFLQFMTFVVLSALCCIKSIEWGASALAGGVAAWIPNAIFLLISNRQKAHEEPQSYRIAWFFVVGEGFKVIFAIAILMIALGVFKAAVAPLVLTYLAVLFVQIIAPAVLSG